MESLASSKSVCEEEDSREKQWFSVTFGFGEWNGPDDLLIRLS